MKAPLSFLFTVFSALSGSCLAADHFWNFDNPGDRFLGGGSAGATFDYYDPGGTGWGPTQTTFGKASSFGLPSLPGGDADVMSFPACTADQGYVLDHSGLPNGVFGDLGWVSNYTIVADVLYPSTSSGRFRSFFQTGPNNTDDGEIYFGEEDGVGIAGRYTGVIQPDTWHRVVIVMRAAQGEGQLHKYVDGIFVGGQGTTGSAINERWALPSDLLMFTDDGGATAPGFVSSIRFIDRNLDYDEVVALGKPTAAGTQVAGQAPAPFPYELPRNVDIIAHRGESGFFPENTLVALEAAFDEGADYCEVDIRLSSDGVAVLMHDATVDRTTDGTGATSLLSADQLTSLDAGSWFGSAFIGEPVPTLEEAYLLAKEKGKQLYLDIKVLGMENAIKDALDGAGVAVEDTWMWVYSNPATAAALRSVMPNAKIIWGTPDASWQSDPAYWDNMRSMGVFGYDLGSGSGTIDVGFALAARAEGFYISNYTLLDPDALINSVSHGAMGLETDFVEITRMMMPPYDIVFPVPASVEQGTILGAETLNATSNIAGTFFYDPPAGTELIAGSNPITATFTPDDLVTYPVRSVTVPFQVTAGPLEISTDQDVYDVGENITVTWSNGPASPTDWIGIYPVGVVPDGDPASTDWNYLNGTRTPTTGIPAGSLTFFAPPLGVGQWNIFFLRNDGYDTLGDPITIEVQGAEIASFRSENPTFEPGGVVTLSWLINENGSTIETLEVDDGAMVTDVAGQSSLVLDAPSVATVYNLRMNGNIEATTMVYPQNDDGSSLTTSKTEYLVGEGLEVTFAGGLGNATDWVGIYPAGALPGSVNSTRWAYVGGTQAAGPALSEGSVFFDFASEPLPEGDYLIFFLADDGYEIQGNPLRLRVSETLSEFPAPEILALDLDPSGAVDLTWTSSPGGSYSVFASTNLADWELVNDSVDSEGETTSFRVFAPVAPVVRRFFRVETN